jgi:hypothetical protein
MSEHVTISSSDSAAREARIVMTATNDHEAGIHDDLQT